MPSHHETPPGSPTESLGPAVEAEGQLRRVSWAAVVRNRWIIITCTLTVVAITAVLTRLTVPVYEGSSTLRIGPKETNLPEAFRNQSSESRVETVIEELRSRELASNVVMNLGLRLALVEPQLSRRSELLQDVRVSDSATTGDYRLLRRPQDRFILLDEATGKQGGEFGVGERVESGGFGFVLAPPVLQYSRIRFSIGTRTGLAARLAREIMVAQVSRDAEIVEISYDSPDGELAWKVPQSLVTLYVAQRQELQTLEMRSTIDFLRQQIATISTQLAVSERELESYRVRSDMINPEAEATRQVERLVSMQTQFSMLEEERRAIAALLAEVDTNAVRRKPGDLSPYHRLLAFPNLLQSQAATGLLQALGAAEGEKATLTRKTPWDPDVKALDLRINQLERELRAIAGTYLQGITSQSRSLDSGTTAFRQQLRSIPEKQLRYARMERQPKVLESVYTLLLTRLKEAEVAVAARDESVRIVDPAVPPTHPIRPRPVLNVITALVCGFLLGLAVAFAREYLDRKVRSRMDVVGATGLPVLGLIPKIDGKASPVALNGKVKVPRRHRHNLPPLIVQLDQTTSAPAMALTISPKAGAIAEAYRVVQTNISFSRQEAPAKTLVFTSPLSGDGKTTTVVNLGVSLAQRGIRVLLIDADVRRGVLHSVFGGVRAPGLSEVLKGTSSYESARRGATVGGGTIDYLTTGKLHHGDLGLVTSDAMRNLLARVRDEYDLVLVDTPPINIITDATVLAAEADAVVVVARAGVTAASALSYAVEQLRHVRADVLGVILNGIDLRRDAVYDSAYKYFRGYEYSTSNT